MAKLDMRTGSTAVMVLRLLVEKPMYGYQIVKELQVRSEGYFELEQGTLYPALHRLEKDGFVQGKWEVVEDEIVVDLLRAWVGQRRRCGRCRR